MILAPGKFMAHGTIQHTAEAPPAFIGWIFLGAGIFFVLLGWALAGMILINGRMLARRRHYLFCQVAAGIECLFMPFGTVLGVFTLIVLQRPSVRALFAPPPAPPVLPGPN